MTSPEPAPRYLRTSEAAAILQVATKTVSRWARNGQLPYVHTLGGHRRYPENEIRQLLTTNTFQAENPPA